jgi:hypothetical protein
MGTTVKGPCRLAICLAATTVLWPGVGRPEHAAAADEFSTKSLVKALSAYVTRYQRQFAFVIADERTNQRVTGKGVVVAERATAGELFVTYLEAEHTWANVHDVAVVDGQPVADRDDLRALLRDGSMTATGRDVAARNARFNIGEVIRNFNEPLFALLVVDDRRVDGVSFSVDRIDRQAPGGPVATLAFRERERPTLVKGLRGNTVYSRGSFVIEPTTGRLRQMRITLDDTPVRAELETTFSPHDALQMWVPSTFTEHYVSTASGGREETTCVSEYSNYRRFDTRSRIK